MRSGNTFIEPGSLEKNGRVEILNDKLRNDLLDMDVSDALAKDRVNRERWGMHDETVRAAILARLLPARAAMVLAALSARSSLSGPRTSSPPWSAKYGHLARNIS